VLTWSAAGERAARRIAAAGAWFFVVVWLWLGLLAVPARAASVDQAGQWGSVLNLGVVGTHQILLHTGKVLLWRAGSEAKVWDPVSGQLTSTPEPFPMADANFHCGAHVVLADGRVLVVGGGDSPHHGVSASALFDPATLKWTRLPDMTSPRWYPSATVLSDGRVLVAGGEDANGVDVDTLEVYDPKANTWTELTGADHNQDLYSRNYLLPDGRIYEAAPRKLTWLFDLGSKNWTSGPSSDWRTNSYSESGAMYRPGKIIRSGGTPEDLASTDNATNRTGIIDMTAGSPKWDEVSPMAFPRRRHNMVIMADGQVMAVGGTQQGNDVDQSVYEGEIWNPDTKQWTTVAAMTNPRAYHAAALLLPDGKVLAAGGEPGDFTSGNGSAITKSGQVYSPPYMFKGQRPAITAASTAAGYHQNITINTADPASIDSVAMIRAGSVTHAIDFEQRYVPLEFARGSGQLTATTPANGNVAPPGWYMLVIKNAAGAPSAATWIRIGDGLSSGGVSPAPPPPSPAPPPPSPPPPGRQPPPTSGPPATGGQPSTGGGQSSTGGTDQPPAGVTPAGTSGGGSRGGTGRITALGVPGRITLRSARRRLAVSMRIESWGDTRTRRVTVRLYRLASGRRHPVLTLTRTAAAPGPRSVTLPSLRLRRVLRAGRYQVQVTVGEPDGRRSPAVRRTIVVL
jgi:galactose oxidase-like protein/Kelch motif protein